MMQLYNDVSFMISKLITCHYSTSFSISVRFLNKEMQKAIYSIYGFVRFADEIVDSFADYEKKQLLEKFENDYYEAYNQGISLNPVLNAFQIVVRQNNIDDELIQAFLKSMKYDLHKTEYKDKNETEEYIYGSANVVGLMCLRVFTSGNEALYDELKGPAMKLGSAFQKVNFLRDLKSDIEVLDRQYFPNTGIKTFNEERKNIIIKDIEDDFIGSYEGIRKLPHGARLGVFIAFLYYKNLLKRIKHIPAGKLIKIRIRVPGIQKFALLLKALTCHKLNII